MHEQAGFMPTYLALGLAALAAVLSAPKTPRDIDADLLWLLTAEATAIDVPPAYADGVVQFAGP